MPAWQQKATTVPFQSRPSVVFKALRNPVGNVQWNQMAAIAVLRCAYYGLLYFFGKPILQGRGG